MMPRLNKLAYSSCSRTIMINANVNRTIHNIQKNRTKFPCRTALVQSLWHTQRNSYSTICGVKRTKQPHGVYRTVVSSQLPENHRQFNVMLTPKHTLLNSCCGSPTILSREITPWGTGVGVGLGAGSSRGLSIQSLWNSGVNTTHYVLGEFADCWPVEIARQFFLCLHDTVGMPWWLVIVTGTVVFRMSMLPLTILSLQSQGKLTNMSSEIAKRTSQITGDVSTAGMFYRQKNITIARQKRFLVTQMQREIYEKYNCGPFKALAVIYVHLPTILCCGMALRSFAGRLGPLADHYIRPEMVHEGVLWFTDLTAADPYCILPTVGFVTSIFVLEYYMLLRSINRMQLNPGISMVTQNRFENLANYITRFAQILVIVFYPILCFAPSSVTLYFCTMSMWTTAQLFILQTPSIKRALNIPKTVVESPNPHQDVLNAFKAKYIHRKKKGTTETKRESL